MATETIEPGTYHPDPEINEGVAADAREAELANLAAGLAPSPWECPCGAQHDRGHTEFSVRRMVHRCLTCGEFRDDGRLMDPAEFTPPVHDYKSEPNALGACWGWPSA